MTIVTINVKNSEGIGLSEATVDFTAGTSTTSVITSGDGIGRVDLAAGTYTVSVTANAVTRSYGAFKVKETRPAHFSGISHPSGTSPVRFQNSQYEHGDVSVLSGDIKLNLRF